MDNKNGITIIFDMDGVLVDSEPVILAAAMAGLKEYGVESVPDDFKPFIGTGEDRFIGGVAEKHGVTYKKEMKKKVYEIYLDIVDEKLGIYENTQSTLHKLKQQGYKLAVASSADRIKIKANLRVAGIPFEFFDAIISGEDVINKKPSPDIYLRAAREVGAEPAKCIVVEDAVNGIIAAKAAGMKCIALTTTFKNEELMRENPDYICSGIMEISNVIKEIIN